MAIINSMGVGKARGSMGNVTYRTVRGRTIGSQKRAGSDPATRAPGDSAEQFVFGLISRFAGARAADIKASFSNTKYGSGRNAFMKLNYAPMKAALLPLYVQGISVTDITDEQINQAVYTYAEANPTAIIRAKLDGEPIVYLTGEWTPELPSVGRIAGATLGGINLSAGVELSQSNVSSGSTLRAVLSGFDEINLLEDGLFIEIAKNGDSNSTIVNTSSATASASGENIVVEGTLSSSISSGTYPVFRVCVRHSEGVGELTSINFANVVISAAGNPL